MKELYFVGMDIIEETKMLVDFTTSICADGMNENELKAYKMGVANTLSALKEVLASADGNFVVNINGMEMQEEFDITDLEHYLLSI
jgi:hypothetical protein